MNKTMRTTIFTALGIAFSLGLVGCSGIAASTASLTSSSNASASAEVKPEITVSASSTVSLVPDKATVTFGVSTQEKAAEDAQSKNSESVKKVISVLTERGVEEKSIRTTYYSMYPQYDWSNNQQRLIGYNVTTSLSVQDQNIDDLGKLLSACVEAGINQIDNVSFLCSGYDEAYSQALSQAVAASRDKAAVLAKAAGKELGEPVNIVEGYQNTSARYTKGVNSVSMTEAAMDAAGPSFQPGETEIAANVTVTYMMN